MTATIYSEPTYYDETADCRFCIEEKKACGRDHVERLAWHWRVSADRPVAKKRSPKAASEKQVSYIRTLLDKKLVTDTTRTSTLAVLDRGATAKDASDLITMLTASPWQPRDPVEDDREESREELEPGMYRVDGTIYKVQESKSSGRLYAKELFVDVIDGETVVSFSYAAGAMRRITADDRLSLEDAAEFGAQYGTCCVCGKLLTNRNSIEAGIGPICAGRL